MSLILEFVAKHWRMFFALTVFLLALAWGEYWHLRARASLSQLAAVIAQDNAAAAKQRADNEAEKARQDSALETARGNYAKDVASIDAYYRDTVRRLRDAARRSSILPAAAVRTKGNISVQCYDKTKLAQGLGAAMDNLQAGTFEILRRGDDSAAALGLCLAFVKSVERK